MARVFLARDLKHERYVAIKVMRPELASGIGQARFLREIKIAARLSHPHILPLFDSGESDGLLYFVMPFVEGASLRVRLMKEGRIPVAEAIEITRNVASALDYAHQHDVVHRDIKPENIMVHAGAAMVADFGIGKALSNSGGGGEGNLTQAGAMIGTPAYMSPEQMAGDPNIDGRADLYSVGCVLYEMLVGEQLFGGDQPVKSLSARFTMPPPDVSAIDRSVPSHVSEAVRRALAPTRDDRYQTAAEFIEGLSAPVVSAAIPVAPAVESVPSVAVLPFDNMSTDPENEFFSDGITEEIISALTQLKHMRVAARTSSFAFKGTNAGLEEIGNKLQVDTVLEGSVRRAGSRVRITAQLINVADGYHLWAERYDRELDDVFAIQDEIAMTIADRLKVTLTTGPDVEPVVKRRTDDVEAYQLYLKGRFLWNRRTKDGLTQAIDYYQQAIDRDPSFALAYAGLADAYLLLGSYFYISRAEAQTKAKAAALKALEIDDEVAEAHTSLGQVLRWELDWEGEEREYRRAIELNPGYATAHHWYATLLGILGRLDEALSEIQRAAELDPLSHAISSTVGAILSKRREYDAAIDQLKRALELEPKFLSASAMLTIVYAQMGMEQEALAQVERTEQARGDHPFQDLFRAIVFSLLGRPDESREWMAQAGPDADPGLAASVHAIWGEPDRAFQLLNRAADEEAWTVLLHIKTDPAYDNVRTDPRYTSLLTRLGLPLD